MVTLPLFLVLLIAVSGAAHAAEDVEGIEEVEEVEEVQEPSLSEQAEGYLETIDRLEDEYGQLRTESAATDDVDAKAVAEVQQRHRLIEWMRTVDRLIDNLVAQQKQGLDVSRLLPKTRKLLWRVDRRLPKIVDQFAKENADLRAMLSDASAEEFKGIQAQVRGTEESLNETVRFYLTHIEHMDALELGSKRARSDAAVKLAKRADDLAARLELASARLGEAEENSGSQADAEDEANVRVAQEALDHVATSLWTTCDVMEELDLPTAKYRQALILATGELTTDVFDTEVVGGLIEDAVEASNRWLEREGPVLAGRLSLFFGILAIFWVLARIVRTATARIAESTASQLSELARRMLVTMAARLVLLVGFFVALSQLGVNVTALLAGLGIAGFVIGFALQETLGNFAAGGMILLYHPFDVGDVIDASGVFGTVHNMNLVSTTILTFDNQMTIVPNSRIWGNVIRNATALEKRRVDLSFRLSLDVDAEQVEALFQKMCSDHDAVLADPPIAIKVQEVTPEGILFVVRPWVMTEDYWESLWSLNREAHLRLNAAGIRVAASRYEFATPVEAPDEPRAN
jgi:small conductance mechanosensitive channel